MIIETFFTEVTGVSRQTRYLQGYGKPATEYTAISLSSELRGGDHSPIRTCAISLPGDLPIGTRFKVTVEQVDEITPATIHRGALPVDR